MIDFATNSEGKNRTNGFIKAPVKTLLAHLTAALDLEEHISNGVYQDYMQPENWPPDFDQKTFETIKSSLAILIADTQKNKRILLHLKRSLSNGSNNGKK